MPQSATAFLGSETDQTAPSAQSFLSEETEPVSASSFLSEEATVVGSPVPETVRIEDMIAPTRTDALLQAPRVAASTLGETGLMTAAGVELGRARAIREGRSSPEALQGNLLASRMMLDEGRSKQDVTSEVTGALSAEKAEESARYFMERADESAETWGLDPRLESGLITQATRGLAKGAGMVALAHVGGIPTLALAGSSEAYANAKKAGASDEDADTAATRSLIGLAIFAGANRYVSQGISRYLGDTTKLKAFLAQTLGQAAGNEVTSRVISAYEAALDAPMGKKQDAAWAALSRNDPQAISQNLGFALMGGLTAAARARTKPFAEPVERSAAPETAQRVQPTAESSEAAQRAFEARVAGVGEAAPEIGASPNVQAETLAPVRQEMASQPKAEITPGATTAPTPEQSQAAAALQAERAAQQPVVSAEVVPTEAPKNAPLIAAPPERREVEVDPIAGVVRTPEGVFRPDAEGNLKPVTPESTEGKSLVALTGEDALKPTAPTETPVPPVETKAPVSETKPIQIETVEFPADLVQAPEGSTRYYGLRAGGASAKVTEYPDRIVINDLFTKPEDRGKGQATAIIESLKSKGQPIELTRGERTEDNVTPEFYEKRGFKRVGETETFRYEPPASEMREVPPSEPPPAPDAAPAATESPTGIRNAIVDRQREAQGLPPRMAPLRQTFGQWWDAAMKRVDDRVSLNRQREAKGLNLLPSAGEELVSSIAREPRALTPEESALLAHETVTRENTYNAAVDAVNKAPGDVALGRQLEDAMKATQEIYDAGQASGSFAGRELASRKFIVNRDYTLGRMLSETQAIANKGEELTKAQIAEVKAQHEEIVRLRAKIAEQESKAADTELKQYFDKLLSDTRRAAKESKSGTSGLVEFINSQADAARARIRERRTMTFADPLGVQQVANLADYAIIGASHIANGITKLKAFTTKLVDEFGDWIAPHAETIFDRAKEQQKGLASMHEQSNKPASIVENAKEGALDRKTVFDLSRAQVNAGVGKQGGEAGMREVFASVTELLKSKFPDVTERQVRDLFSDYGKVTYPSKAEDLTRLREFRRLGQLVSAIEDAQRKIAPKRTGQQRDEPTQAIREKMKELQAAMREAGIETTSPEQQLKSVNAARATALRNRIADLDKQLQTGEKSPARKTVPDSPEVERLRAERDAMQAEVDRIESEANPPTPAEQKALNDALVSRERWDRILSGEETPTTKAPKEALTDLESDVRAEIAAMKEQAAKMRREALPKKDPNAAAEEARIKALEKATAEYERRVREADIVPKGKKQGPPTERVAKAQAARDAAKAAFDALVDASKPVRTPEEIALQRYKATITKKTKDLQSKIDVGDYTKPERRTTVLDSEATKARFEYEKALEKFNRGLLEEKLRKESIPKKIGRGALESVNTARAIMTSLDLSAVLRQGGFIALGNPVRAAKSFVPMLRALGATPTGALESAKTLGKSMLSGRGLKSFVDAAKSWREYGERMEFAVNEEISNRPNAPLYNQSGLYLAKEGTTLAKMEEAYMSRWAKNIPLVAGSQRAYTTFLNKLRADSFDAMVEYLPRGGKPTAEEAKAIATFINAATGRGSVGIKNDQLLTGLNTLFFAPRYVASRFQLLAGPLTGFRFGGGSARTRLLIATEYAKYLNGVAIVMGLGALAGGVLEDDPRSADFGKIKFGDSRLDPLSGLSQNTVFLGKLSGKRKHTETGRLEEAKITDTLTSFARAKLAPIPGAVWTGLQLRAGQKPPPQYPQNYKDLGLNLVTPINVGEILKVMVQQGVPRGTALALLSELGAGLQTYEIDPKRLLEARRDAAVDAYTETLPKGRTRGQIERDRRDFLKTWDRNNDRLRSKREQLENRARKREVPK